jgi:hypothetical protein
MSAREEKLEQAAKRATGGPARCTLAQLRSSRWGRVTAPERLWVGAEVQFEGMGGEEVWRVSSLTGLADEQVHLERTT